MLNAKDFYSKFDSRTKMCTNSQGFEAAKCIVRFTSNFNSYSNQLVLVATCNLLSRWCREVFLDLPSEIFCHEHIADSTTPLVEWILQEMKDVNPFGKFKPFDGESATVELLVGSGVRDCSDGIQINGASWFASIGCDLPLLNLDNADRNPFGPIAAACLGVAEAFRRTEQGNAVKTEPLIFDVYTLKTCDSVKNYESVGAVNVGEILMIGAGAVASSVVYCFQYLNLTGSLTCVDFDTVKIENLNRSPLLKFQDVGQPKVNVVAQALADSAIDVKPINEEWETFKNDRPRAHMHFGCWLPLANERNVRWSIQNNFPPQMIHASTSSNWIVNFGRHIPFKDDCLVDRFPEQEVKPAFACSSGEMNTPSGAVDAALPFLSTFAGLLVAADLVRRNFGDHPQTENFAEFGFRNGFRVQTRNRTPGKNCLCQSLPKELWLKLIK